MKRIGILFGQERTFPQALIERINREGGDVVAEPVKVGGVSLDSPRRYDLILDRISQDIPFYRAILKKAVADGTVVVNNPFWWSADDKFFNNVVARAAGVAVPKTVLLPSHAHPPDTTGASMSNLTYPLDWEAIFSHIGFPAYFRLENSWAKLLGIAVLLAPLPPRLKEWAYAGFAIDLGSALIAHFAVGDGAQAWGWAAGTALLGGLSYYFFRRVQPAPALA